MSETSHLTQLVGIYHFGQEYLFICLLAFVSGNTYDRSIEVDEEEASILLYDIWEQVRHIMQIMQFQFDPQ